MKPPTCHCGSKMELRDSKYGRFWGCVKYPKCDGIIGVHKKDDSPLGWPGDKACRQARIRAHDAFDEWWSNTLSDGEPMTRTEAYEWLADNSPAAHIGELDEEQCGELIETLEEMMDEEGEY